MRLAVDSTGLCARRGMSLRGYIDIATRSEVSGWVMDPDDPHTPVSLLISIDDTLLGRVLADRFRDGLAEAGVGDGRHAFSLRLGGHVDLFERCVLHVRREGDGAEVPGSPVVIEPPTGLDAGTRAGFSARLLSPCDDTEFDARLAFLVEQTDQLLQSRAERRSRRSERLLRRHHQWRWSELRGEPAPAAPAAPTLRALVIDTTMPDAARDAGSNAVLSHMRSLQRLGYEITLVAADLSVPADPACFAALGITWCGAPLHASVEEVLRREAGGFDLVYLHRISVARRYIALVRDLMPRTRLVYSVADLHYLRLARQASVEQRPELMATSRRMQVAELSAAWGADAVVTHSTYEAKLLRDQVPGARVHVVPWAVPLRRSAIPFAQREGVAFIANYAHAPNLDAALWLIEEMMPRLHQVDATMQCLLVGSAMPPMLRQAHAGVVALGQVPDLAEVFARVRLTIAPLLFGAGVKGKVLESFAAGIPCACTPIAAEGLDLPEQLQAQLVSEPDTLAEVILRLHADEAVNMECAEMGLGFAGTHWSEARVDAAMRDVVV